MCPVKTSMLLPIQTADGKSKAKEIKKLLLRPTRKKKLWTLVEKFLKTKVQNLSSMVKMEKSRVKTVTEKILSRPKVNRNKAAPRPGGSLI